MLLFFNIGGCPGAVSGPCAEDVPPAPPGEEGSHWQALGTGSGQPSAWRLEELGRPKIVSAGTFPLEFAHLRLGLLPMSVRPLRLLRVNSSRASGKPAAESCMRLPPSPAAVPQPAQELHGSHQPIQEGRVISVRVTACGLRPTR